MIDDEALAEARAALGPAASLRVFDPALGKPGPPLEEPIAAIIRERDEARAEVARLTCDLDAYKSTANVSGKLMDLTERLRAQPGADAMAVARVIVPPFSLSDLRGLSRVSLEALEQKWVKDIARSLEQHAAHAREQIREEAARLVEMGVVSRRDMAKAIRSLPPSSSL